MKWMADCAVDGSTRLRPTYDDVLDVLRALLLPVPVNEDWYQAEYPAIPDYLAHMPNETATSHFQKHGYFEGRKPFEPGWRGLTAPVPFAQIKTRMRLVPARGRLQVDIEVEEFRAWLKKLLIAVPVDEEWYLSTYPNAARAIDVGTFDSAATHYAERGYFAGWLPFAVEVDETWYHSRYEHVRTALERGVAKSAQDHFLRMGYNERCRPTPP